MNVEEINPFLESVLEFFERMLRAKAQRGRAGLAWTAAEPHQITALIGLGGRVRGTVALSFPVATALSLVERFTGATVLAVDEAVYDAVMEAVNIVAGGAKRRLARADEDPIALSLPSVIRGSDFSVVPPTTSVWLDIPFESDVGRFNMRVTLEAGGKGAAR